MKWTAYPGDHMIHAYGQVNILSTDDPAWADQLCEVPHDIYHRPEYHELTGFAHQGTPYLFSYREDGHHLFLWPYFLRPIAGTADFDVTSAYGYSGPVATGDREFLARAWTSLFAHWREQRAVCAFTRFHPMMGNSRHVVTPQAAAGMSLVGSTVSIDLSVPPGEQLRGYRRVLRQEIRAAREAGFTTAEDGGWESAAEFVRLYNETMTRRHARVDYRIDEEWLAHFRLALGSHARLFITRCQGRVAAGLLTMQHGPFLHAHLTGINVEMAGRSPLKILLDDVRQWGSERGLRAFHLGGGLGGREDSLYHFKRRFSHVTHEFHVGRWVLNHDRYDELKRTHRQRMSEEGRPGPPPDFFPAYRYPPAGVVTPLVSQWGASLTGS